ncbi:hypothetical protein BCR32DRAFT_328352 [Anaeromyces robustus]|uniref:Condensation domain-containing protein n=1 Tax=Anaeromyces robustus TaxID=1754192 RepID=A0A1Y1WZR8_9FUNG|nr:hypothetical protein BCR32DRAFT_328352 [Anaeromyces robustus]|eukprot:ORX78885.1 hypothetical protein BCR32DRAFT_328352 [Anaeromyces robustus]
MTVPEDKEKINNELLKNPALIRPMDGAEYGESFIWLSMSDEIPIKVNLKNFRIKFEEIASKYPSFNVGAKGPTWIKLPIDSEYDITEIEYEERKDIENMSPSNKEDNHLWYINISYKENTTRITLHVSHALCDGRTLETMFLVVMHSVIESLNKEEKEELLNNTNYKHLPSLPIPCDLCEFGQKSNFFYEKIPKELLNGVPESWKKCTPLDLPKIDLPNHYVGSYFEYDDKYWDSYFKKMMKEKNIKLSLQAAMMASESRALRKFCHLEYDYPIVTNVMYDSRMNKLAKEEYKKREFFFGALSGFPIVIGQNDWEKDILHCKEVLSKDVQLLDGLGMLLQIADSMNKETLELTPVTGIPAYTKNNIVVTTYINHFKGYIKPRIGVRLACGKDYFVCQYAWRNEGKIHFMILHPKTIDKKYIDSFKNEFDELFKFFEEKSK